MGSLLHERSLEKSAFSRSTDLARYMQKQKTGNPVNRWPTEETLLGAFFDVTNPMKVSDAQASSTSAPDRLRKHWLAATVRRRDDAPDTWLRSGSGRIRGANPVPR
jgi:hypothetical protein